MKKGNKYGVHRVIEPQGVLPQPANKLDNNMDELYDNEILIDVITLNVDSASFTQIKEQSGGDEEKIKEIMFDIVAKQGKHRNPVTGSGGMLLGRVEKIGSALEGKINLKVGDKIATLVSLSLTPLRIDKIKAIRKDVDQVDIEGKAILFESGIYAKIPDDMPEKLALSALDVAGAPAQTAKLVKPGDIVVIIGAGGKSGMLCCYEAKKRAGVTGKVIGITHSEKSTKRLQDLGFCDHVFPANATLPVAVMEKVAELTNGEMADITINNVNINDTEMTSILCTKDTGTVYFFSMATSFTKAALGAEGVGSDVTMIVGNGYTKGHAEITLELLRESKKLRDIFTELYA
ncbi:MAG: zinc-binding dehydrogenase [Lentimicrobium sp.]|jgi:L-erythro-3,5-diaminohexanoate dehydrogenase|nr:zinc-binding dehydrogenase [Lentimicrobium sp.]MDD2527223.1 zinc-binding dehydrogenase [Lentimicrobiaceae bacterium]MDD4596598.1 zinc-binding dehydrogenase [Lentimicrobiaceae bacterium]MDY0024893.1 zinc-binding dehydrogenase [Lentimicrobium sp.]HAH59559.1 L-erythro-3,5-diaminohexanoate dehydrogenase [Bacteroidales bacterium]